MQFEFTGPVYLWEARTEAWYFTSLPEDISEMIAEIPRPTRGFGAVRVDARIGLTRFRTSIFPDAKKAAYVLPLKRSVRDAEGIADGDEITVELVVLDA